MQLFCKSTEAWEMGEMEVEGLKCIVNITCSVRSWGPQQGSKALNLQTFTHLLNLLHSLVLCKLVGLLMAIKVII